MKQPNLLYSVSLFIITILVSFTTSAQLETKNGYFIPIQGTVRVLLIFAEVDYTAGACIGGTPSIAGAPAIDATNYWGVDGFGVTQIPPDAGTLFDPVMPVSGIPNGYITGTYFDASMGKYILLGDYYPEVVRVPCTFLNPSSSAGNHAQAVIDQLNLKPGATLFSNSGIPLSNFDLFDWNQFALGLPKAPSAGVDKGIDIMFIIWRNSKYVATSACTGGFGLVPTSTGSLKDMVGGVQGISSFNGCGGANGAIGITLAEYMHGIYGGNNWHSANGAGEHTFMIPPNTWSITGQSGSTMRFVNAWDRWMLDWEHPDKNQTDGEFISVGDQTTGEVTSDLSIQTHPNTNTFTLRDLTTTGDAIRIKLPHVENTTAKTQYLWIENRRMNTRFDEWYSNSPGSTPDNNGGLYQTGTPGLYAFIQVGKDKKTGTSTSDLYPTFPLSHTNALASWLYPLTAEGNYDFTYRYDLEQAANGSLWGNWGNPNIPIEKATSLQNPLTGYSDLYQLINYDHNNQLSNSGDGIQAGLSEVDQNEVVVHNYNSNGDWQDAFSSATGNTKISISTNPASVPVYTLHSALNIGAIPSSIIQNYENRTTWLSGLSIEITNENMATGEVTVQVRWDDYDVNNDVRWCGNIVLQNDVNDPLTRQSQINLKTGNNILLDQGISATKPIASSQFDGEYLFADPTILSLESGTQTIIEAGSELKVVNGSTLHIKSGATVIVQGDGKITIDDGAFLCVEAGATFFLQDPLSELYISEFASTGINPSLSVSGSCSNRCEIQALITGLGFMNRTYIVDAGEDQVFCSTSTGNVLGGSPTQIGGTSPLTYNWMPAIDLDDNTLANPTITNAISADLTFILNAQDATGCTDIDDITVFINSTSPVLPGILTNAHLENTTLGQPDDWQGVYVNNEPPFPSSILIGDITGTSLSSLSSNHPAPQSGCSDVDLPLDNGGLPTYLTQTNQTIPLAADQVYVLDAKVKIDNSTVTGNTNSIDIKLINEVEIPSSGGMVRPWYLNKNLSLSPSGSTNPLLSGWNSYKACFATESYWGGSLLNNVGLRFNTDYSPVSDINVHVDYLSVEPITNLTEPITSTNYSLAPFSPTGGVVQTLFNGANWWNVSDKSINTTNFPLAPNDYNQVYLLKQRTDAAPDWNSLTRYQYNDNLDIVVNGSIIMQPYTHLNVIGTGTLTLGNDGRICIGLGGELIIPENSTFKYGGGVVEMMYANACLGVFGGTFEILENADLVIEEGFFFQTEKSKTILQKNSSFTIRKTGQFIYESGSKIQLEKDETLIFDETSRLTLDDSHKDIGDIPVDPHLSIILDCGELITNWNNTELPSKIAHLNIYHTWDVLKRCQDKIYPTPTMQIMTEKDDSTVFYNDLDLTNYSNILITGKGQVLFDYLFGSPENAGIIVGGTTDDKVPSMIVLAPNTQIVIEPSSTNNVDSLEELIIKSGMIVDYGSTLEIKNGATLVVEAEATLLIRSGSNFIVNEGAKVILKNGAFLCVEDSVIMDIDSLAEFTVYTGVNYGINSKLELVSNCMDSLDFEGVKYTCGSSLDDDYIGPIADFELEHPCTEINNEFDFIYTGGTEGGASYLWDFGTNAAPVSSTDANPVGIIFSNDGQQQVTLTVKRFGCVSSIIKTVNIVNPIACQGNQGKVLICHVPPGNPNNTNELCVSTNAVSAHLNHGDCVGSCDDPIITVDYYNEWVDGVNSESTTETNNLIDLEEVLANDFRLYNYPNPFKGSTIIKAIIPENSSQTFIIVRNIMGNEIYRKQLQIGINNIVIGENVLSSGIYFYSIETNNANIISKKMIKVE